MLVSLNSVTYSVDRNRNKRVLLKDINFTISPNTITTIIGPNGAGKTTLVRLILSLIKPTSGTINRKKNIVVGYVPQKLNANKFMPMTVESFVDLCGTPKINFPFDISKLMNQSIHDLSGGELQKVLLNAAVLQKPDLLILDEPTQGIDADGQSTFYKKLLELKHEYKMAIVIISHDLHFVFDCTDHVICLNQHICCQGSPEMVRSTKEVQHLFPRFSKYQHNHDHQHI